MRWSKPMTGFKHVCEDYVVERKIVDGKARLKAIGPLSEIIVFDDLADFQHKCPDDSTEDVVKINEAISVIMDDFKSDRIDMVPPHFSKLGVTGYPVGALKHIFN